MQKVSGGKVVAPATDSESALPAEVVARLGELIEAASEGLLAHAQQHARPSSGHDRVTKGIAAA